MIFYSLYSCKFLSFAIVSSTLYRNIYLYDEGRYAQPVDSTRDDVRSNNMKLERQSSTLSSFIQSVQTEGRTTKDAKTTTTSVDNSNLDLTMHTLQLELESLQVQMNNSNGEDNGDLVKEIGLVLSTLRETIQTQQAVKQISIKDQSATKTIDPEKAALIIQSWYRGVWIRNVFVDLKDTTIRLQAWLRGARVRQDLRRQIKSATTIQSFARMMICRNEYLLRRELAEEDDCDDR